MSQELARGAVVGVGALIAHHISAGGFARDSGKANVPPKSSAEKPARLELVTMPCGARRLPAESHGIRTEGKGEVGEDFLREWAIQTKSLAAEFGVIAAGRPALTAACCVDWIDRWLSAWWAARSKDHERFRVFRAYPVPPEQAVLSKDEPPVWPSGGPLSLEHFKRSDLGNVWYALIADRRDAKAHASEQGTYLHARQVCERLRDFAGQLDLAARRDRPSDGPGVILGTLENAPEQAKKVFTGIGNGLAWTIEELVAPVLGSTLGAAAGVLVSSLAPYLVLGGLGYFVWRRA